VGTQRCFDELNSTEPEAVFRVHQAYIEAGAQILKPTPSAPIASWRPMKSSDARRNVAAKLASFGCVHHALLIRRSMGQLEAIGAEGVGFNDLRARFDVRWCTRNTASGSVEFSSSKQR